MSRAGGVVNRARLLDNLGKLSEEKRQLLRDEVDEFLKEAHVLQPGITYTFDYGPLRGPA